MIAVRLAVPAAALAAFLAATAPSSGTGAAGTSEQPLPGAPRSRSESSLVVDPRDPRHVVVGVMEYGGRPTDPAFYLDTWYAPTARLYVSRDGGATYRDGGTLPGLGGTTLDQTLAWDPRGGALYAGYLAYDGTPAETDTRGGFYVARSTDGGAHWRAVPVMTTEHDGDVCRAPDKPTVVVDGRGTVHAVWQVITGSPCPEWQADLELVWSRSTDGGRTWSAPVTVAEPGEGYAPMPVPLPDGSLLVVYAGMWVGDATYPECLGEWEPIRAARVARDGTVTASGVLDHVCTMDGVSRNGSAFRVHQMPTVAYDPRTRSVVVAVTDLRPGDEGLAVATSRDGGRTWQRSRVPAEPGWTYTHPQLAAGAGAVAVSYLASGPAGTYTPTLRASSDGGRSWTAGVALASQPSLGAQRPYSRLDPYTVGHYQGLAIGRDGLAHAAWPDLRPRAEAGDVDTWVRAVPLPR
ncbi:MAG TPA: sialidase family protein [Mycobacteriales bacterium]|jgi:hypothetical protein